MKQVTITGVCLLLLTTGTVLAQRNTAEGWTGFSLNQLETLSNNVFEQLDADENGSITLDEIDLFKEDSEETLSEEEQFLRQRRLSLVNSYFWTEQDVDMFEVGDTNQDGSMNRDEFDNLQSNVRTHILELGIQSLDKDKNGSVEANEFSAHLDKFEEWDTNGNGTIDREEIGEISDRRLFTDMRRRWSSRELSQVERDRAIIATERSAAERERRAAASEKSDSNKREAD